MYWLQKDGTAMGAPPAPTYATIYYSIHKLDLIVQFSLFLKFYKRYIDDAIAIWRSCSDPMEDAQQWALFQDVMTFGKLTWEVEPRSSSIGFMDLTISIKDTRLVTKIYEKPQNLYLYLPSSSCHTPPVS